MLRLFIAVDLPDDAIAELGRIELPRTAGMRVIPPEQMHLTLHFLGNEDVERMVDALQEIAVPPFSLCLEGTGEFTARDASVILWAGVKENAELSRLHAAIATTISKLGFKPESRPFTPHLTLARYKQGLPSDQVTAFLAEHEQFMVPDIPITTFGLYSSALGKQGPVYHCERSFPLYGADYQTGVSPDL